MTVTAKGRNRIVAVAAVAFGETRDQRPLVHRKNPHDLCRGPPSSSSSPRTKATPMPMIRVRTRFRRISILVLLRALILLLGCHNTVVLRAWEMTPSTSTSTALSRASRSFFSGRSTTIRPNGVCTVSDRPQHCNDRKPRATMGRRTILHQSSSEWTETDRNNNNSSSSSSSSDDNEQDGDETGPTNSEEDPVGWQSNLPRDQYASPILWETRSEWETFMTQFQDDDSDDEKTITNRKDFSNDHLWEQVKLEALSYLGNEPEAGPQLYQNILSQKSLVEAIVSIIANEVESELIKATEIKKVFLDMLTEEDEEAIHCDVIAAATRSPSVELAVLATLFHTGLHALICYRVGHRLWHVDRTGLAKYLQSTVSRHYSADIHPACLMGQGIYLCTASGVVIGETATVGNDVSILHGVTLGGTGKELGDRHPKVQHGVILKDCATVLGNIPVGTGAVVMAKAIVNKPVPPLAIMSGVPAKVIDHRVLEPDAFYDDLEEHLAFKYLDEWRELRRNLEESENQNKAPS